MLHIPILIYHSVRPDYAGETEFQKAFSITPEILDEQLAFLQKNGYTVISMDELAKDIQHGTTSPVAKPVVLTFDDGWKNQYIYAFPILKKYHDTATFYVYTKAIGAYPHFMTWDELRQLRQAGMTIGDHTVSHPYLWTLSPQDMQREIMEAKNELETHLGTRISHFASPYGFTSPELVSLLAQDGFITGRTTHKGAYHSQDDVLRLSAFLVHRNIHEFAQEVR